MFRMWKEGVDGSFANAAPMVFEKGGGGTPPPPDPMAEARAQDYLDQQRAAREAAAREAEEREKAAQRKIDLKDFGARLNSAYTGAQQYGRSQLNRLGIPDTFGLLQDYNQRLATARSSVPELATDIGAYLDPNKIWDATYDDVRAGQRNKLNASLNQMFTNGYEENAIQDTADDAYISEFLDPQYEEAVGSVERARARGQLNDTAYQSATRGLTRQRAAANSRAQGLGMGVLAKYRQALTGDIGNLRTRVQNYDLADNLDLNTERGRIDQRVATNLQRLRDDVGAALSDQEFFDLDNLLGRAMAAGGTTNDGTGTAGGGGGNLASAMATALSDAERRRQLGNAGVF